MQETRHIYIYIYNSYFNYFNKKNIFFSFLFGLLKTDFVQTELGPEFCTN
jgi:hypothetical protein